MAKRERKDRKRDIDPESVRLLSPNVIETSLGGAPGSSWMEIPQRAPDPDDTGFVSVGGWVHDLEAQANQAAANETADAAAVKASQDAALLDEVRRAFELPLRPGESTTGALLIGRERLRQILVEGFGAEHDDDEEAVGDLAQAAICYAGLAGLVPDPSQLPPPATWPWKREWWKPSLDPARNLVKAGALIAAELDRTLRYQVRDETLAPERAVEILEVLREARPMAEGPPPSGPVATLLRTAQSYWDAGDGRKLVTTLFAILRESAVLAGDVDADGVPGITDPDDDGYQLVQVEHPARFKPFFLAEAGGELVFVQGDGSYHVATLDGTAYRVERARRFCQVNAEDPDQALRRYHRGKIEKWLRRGGEAQKTMLGGFGLGAHLETHTRKPLLLPETYRLAWLQSRVASVDPDGYYNDPALHNQNPGGLKAARWCEVEGFSATEAYFRFRSGLVRYEHRLDPATGSYQKVEVSPALPGRLEPPPEGIEAEIAREGWLEPDPSGASAEPQPEASVLEASAHCGPASGLEGALGFGHSGLEETLEGLKAVKGPTFAALVRELIDQAVQNRRSGKDG